MSKRDDSDNRPPHPYKVLAIAALFPGMGQVLNGQPDRGLMMAFCTLVLGWVSYHLTTPDHSLVGRYAGGIFVYSIAAMEAYRLARIRWETWRASAKNSSS